VKIWLWTSLNRCLDWLVVVLGDRLKGTGMLLKIGGTDGLVTGLTVI
jgi:hypothetical protein